MRFEMKIPLLLVHGLFGSLSAPGILAPFTNKSVFTPDLIGYGQYREQYGREWTLNDQADHLENWIRTRTDEPVHLAGHSVGGAVAVLMAKRYPEKVCSLTLIEGNLTLGDAFWSQKIASQSLDEIQAEVNGFREDITAWIARAGVKPTKFAIETATDWLDNQPVATLRAQARAVVSETRKGSYLEGLRSIVSSGLPVHLLSGAHSRSGWNVPGWLEENATTDQIIPQAGHLMMIEQPEIFALTVLNNLTD
jgi:pimeloyl-ACP methyl ester carboxylesterase